MMSLNILKIVANVKELIRKYFRNHIEMTIILYSKNIINTSALHGITLSSVDISANVCKEPAGLAEVFKVAQFCQKESLNRLSENKAGTLKYGLHDLLVVVYIFVQVSQIYNITIYFQNIKLFDISSNILDYGLAFEEADLFYFKREERISGTLDARNIGFNKKYKVLNMSNYNFGTVCFSNMKQFDCSSLEIDEFVCKDKKMFKDTSNSDNDNNLKLVGFSHGRVLMNIMCNINNGINRFTKYGLGNRVACSAIHFKNTKGLYTSKGVDAMFFENKVFHIIQNVVSVQNAQMRENFINLCNFSQTLIGRRKKLNLFTPLDFFALNQLTPLKLQKLGAFGTGKTMWPYFSSKSRALLSIKSCSTYVRTDLLKILEYIYLFKPRLFPSRCFQLKNINEVVPLHHRNWMLKEFTTLPIVFWNLYGKVICLEKSIKLAILNLNIPTVIQLIKCPFLSRTYKDICFQNEMLAIKSSFITPYQLNDATSFYCIPGYPGFLENAWIFPSPCSLSYLLY